MKATSRSTLLLVVLTMAVEVSSLSPLVSSKTSPISGISSKGCSKRTSVTEGAKRSSLSIGRGQTVCRATVERTSFSSMTGDDSDDDNHSFSVDNGANGHAVNSNNGQQHIHNQHNHNNNPHNNNNNNHRHQQQNWKYNPKKGGKKRPSNPAMEDTAFLRKRTETLLALSSDIMSEDETISSRGMKVDMKTFHFLMDAWAFSGEDDAAEQAAALLSKMEQLFVESTNHQLNHDHTNNNVSIIRPDVRSYTKVINAISRTASPQAGQWAEDILEKMMHLYQSGINPAAKPNTYTYTAVVEAHANSGVSGSAQSAEAICDYMCQQYMHNEQDPDVAPTARIFNAAINAYAKSDDADAAQRADDLFRRMEGIYWTTGLAEIKPNAYNYNSLISAWANCGQEGAAERAEEVLERMEALYKEGDKDVKPTTVTYNAVIDAYSKCAGGATHHDEYDDAAGERAESILHHMQELYHSGENVDAKPNVRSYNTVINVWYVVSG